MTAADGILGASVTEAGRDSVKETTSATFRNDVIAESARRPVLVDFWAPWCGPCRALTPIIEKVVKATGGAVLLVKMNIDEHPQIAGQLGIQSIPAVIAFQNGQPVDGFMGALPESQIKTFIERLVGPVGNPLDDLLKAGEGALNEGDAHGAAAAFMAVAAQEPSNSHAAAGLVRVHLLAGDLEFARSILDAFDGNKDDGALKAARAALDLAEEASALGDLAELKAKVAASPGDHALRFDLATALNAEGERAEAADALLEIIRRERSWNEDGARKQLVQFFEAWGPMDPATITARRKLSAILFS